MIDHWWSGAMAWVRAHWAIISRVASIVFIGLVITLLIYAATQVEWAEVVKAIRALPAGPLWIAGLIVLASYLLYSTFDLLGKWYTEHPVAWWRVMMVGFISYAFTMNMGAPIGGLGLRMRLYSKFGLAQGVIMRVMALSVTTNWMGYTFLAGVIFALGGVQLPSNWELGNGPFRLIGVALIAAGVAYLLLCAFSRTRSWDIRGHTIELPTLKLALVQISIAALNWALMGGVIYVLMQQQVPYHLVLGTLLVSAIIGALMHVPGGLGVLESVFIALLASEALPRSQVLGAILVYRAMYYIVPFFIAGVWYLAAEARLPASEGAAQGPSTDYSPR
ncbi:MAG: UPF0104 family protein [Candidimonas sp.]|nr:UPF0104 family protein [Candidimonas sp.]NYT45936.1 UPF0104 family protein [Alcaligenaceae bacterium]